MARATHWLRSCYFWRQEENWPPSNYGQLCKAKQLRWAARLPQSPEATPTPNSCLRLTLLLSTATIHKFSLPARPSHQSPTLSPPVTIWRFWSLDFRLLQYKQNPRAMRNLFHSLFYAVAHALLLTCNCFITCLCCSFPSRFLFLYHLQSLSCRRVDDESGESLTDNGRLLQPIWRLTGCLILVS
jgi:hypothetical protein